MVKSSDGALLTVSRTLRLLRAFTEERPSWGVTELGHELELDKSQVHRILKTLAQQGFAVFDPGTRRYSLGPALVVLGRRAEHSPGIQRRVDPLLQALSEQTGESTVLCVPDGVRYRTIAAAEGPARLRYATSVGLSYPGNLGAAGHAIFAFHRTIDPAELLSSQEADDRHVVQGLRQRHEEVRADGFAISVGEFDARVMAIAAPIHVENSIFGSVSALGPPEYMQDRVDEIVAAVLTSASRLAEILQG